MARNACKMATSQLEVAMRITKASEAIPGILYCLFTIEYDPENDVEMERDGALVYWTGECWMDESGDERHDYWDFAVSQGGDNEKQNPEFIVKRHQSLLHPEMESIVANWQTLTAQKKAY
jgi:hypothetical protein